jgi:hypothetical protein
VSASTLPTSVTVRYGLADGSHVKALTNILGDTWARILTALNCPSTTGTRYTCSPSGHASDSGQRGPGCGLVALRRSALVPLCRCAARPDQGSVREEPAQESLRGNQGMLRITGPTAAPVLFAAVLLAVTACGTGDSTRLPCCRDLTAVARIVG